MILFGEFAKRALDVVFAGVARHTEN
jgi:hypothetical protein